VCYPLGHGALPVLVKLTRVAPRSLEATMILGSDMPRSDDTGTSLVASAGTVTLSGFESRNKPGS